MCGIAGFVKLDGAPPAFDPMPHLAAMGRMLAHRGPDSRGAWSEGPVGFAHTRLKVIDLSSAADQPMQEARGDLRIVLNGEIYNFRELRSDLEALGHRFRTRSDTEVVLEGYRAWGDGVLDRLRGMFAFALWDGPARRLLLARDPFGKKPLYYANHDGALLFASECKAIVAWPGFRRRPDLAAIHDYLTLQYVPSPRTAFEGVARLHPGEAMVVAQGAAPRFFRFASLPAPPTAPDTAPAADLPAAIRNVLTQAVRKRLVADVPVGAFLSGGVDSSAVVALMAQEGGAVKTFSAVFREAPYDERDAARLVSRRFATEHHEIELEAPDHNDLSELAWHFDQPFADSSAFGVYRLAALARHHVTVALSGDGGDELFLGYTRYEDLRRAQWVERLPKALRCALGHVAEVLPPAAEQWRPSRVLRRLLAAVDARDSRRYAAPMAYFRDIEKRDGYGPALAPYARASTLDVWQRYFDEAGGAVAGAAWADLNSYLPDDILVKLDVATMAHGLEARCPFLDFDLARSVAALPVEVRMSGGRLKGLLKEALAPLVPEEILSRPKMGFGMPILEWSRAGLAGVIDDTILSRRFAERGLFREAFVRRLVAEHRAGRVYHHPRVWALIMLELWYRTWIDEVAPPVGGTGFAAPSFAVVSQTGA